MSSSCSAMGGRRRHSRKTRRHSRKMRGGNGYGMGNNPIAVGAAEWAPNMTSVEGGAPYMPPTLGGRRRKSRKGKASRRRRRSMRGGGSVANVGASFQGDGQRGIQTYVPYNSNAPMGLVPGGSNGAY